MYDDPAAAFITRLLVNAEFSKLGTPLDVQIRKKVFSGEVVKKKFYDKHYKK